MSNRENETRSLPVTLTENEFKVRASELATAALRVKNKESEIKEIVKSMKSDLSELEKDHVRLINIVDEKREYRDVSCSWSPDFDRRMWVLFRDDIHEEVATEAMSERDLQTRFGFNDSGNN